MELAPSVVWDPGLSEIGDSQWKEASASLCFLPAERCEQRLHMPAATPLSMTDYTLKVRTKRTPSFLNLLFVALAVLPEYPV